MKDAALYSEPPDVKPANGSGGGGGGARRVTASYVNDTLASINKLKHLDGVMHDACDRQMERLASMAKREKTLEADRRRVEKEIESLKQKEEEISEEVAKL